MIKSSVSFWLMQLDTPFMSDPRASLTACPRGHIKADTTQALTHWVLSPGQIHRDLSIFSARAFGRRRFSIGLLISTETTNRSPPHGRGSHSRPFTPLNLTAMRAVPARRDGSTARDEKRQGCVLQRASPQIASNQPSGLTRSNGRVEWQHASSANVSKCSVAQINHFRGFLITAVQLCGIERIWGVESGGEDENKPL